MVIVEKIRHILQSEPALRPGSGPSEKVDPGHLEKADPTPECVILVKKLLFDKFEGADFKFYISFFKY